MKVFSLVSAGLMAMTTEARKDDQVVCSKEHVCHDILNEQLSAAAPRSLSSKKGTVLSNTNVKTVLNIDTGDDAPNTRFGLTLRLPMINNYGCWCYGGDFWPGARDWTGFGPFMDQWDDACKAHHQGFDCIVMDAEDESESCIPNETEYALLVKPQANGDYTLECADDIAENWCQRRVCMVDLRFIARSFELEDLGIEPNYEAFGHAGFHDNVGDFNTDVCILPRTQGPGGHEGVEKRCCGDYPYRVWYDKRNIRGLQCCTYEDASVNEEYGFEIKIGKLYNRLSATCCDYGVITDGNQCA